MWKMSHVGFVLVWFWSAIFALLCGVLHNLLLIFFTVSQRTLCHLYDPLKTVRKIKEICSHK